MGKWLFTFIALIWVISTQADTTQRLRLRGYVPPKASIESISVDQDGWVSLHLKKNMKFLGFKVILQSPNLERGIASVEEKSFVLHQRNYQNRWKVPKRRKNAPPMRVTLQAP